MQPPQGAWGNFPQQARKCMYMELAKCTYTYTACEVLVGKAKYPKNNGLLTFGQKAIVMAFLESSEAWLVCKNEFGIVGLLCQIG